MDIIDKAKRLEELAKALDADEAVKNLVSAALELVTELAQELESLTEQVDDLDDAFEELCEDVYGDEEDGEAFEVECPGCGELIQIDEGILEEGSITCPGCDETLEFDLGCDCENCNCEDCEEKD